MAVLNNNIVIEWNQGKTSQFMFSLDEKEAILMNESLGINLIWWFRSKGKGRVCCHKYWAEFYEEYLVFSNIFFHYS